MGVGTAPGDAIGDRRPRDPETQVRDDRLVGLLVGAGLFAFYITVQYGDFLGWDGRTMANVTHNIVERGRPITTQDVSWSINEFRGSDKSPFGIGLSLALIPFWLIQRAIDPDHGYWLTLLNPAVTALTGIVVYRLGLVLRWQRLSAVLAALAFGLVTMAPAYSIELFNEPAVALCLAVAVLGLVRMGEARGAGAWMLGVSAGAACLFRYDSFLLVVPLIAAVPLFVEGDDLRRNWLRWSVPAIVPTTAAVMWTLVYNAYRSGSPLDLSTGGTFTTPLLEGIQRQVLSSGKGFFWYNPLLIAAIPGVYLLWRRNRPVALVVIALFAARVVFFARYWNPDGSVAWGPRYLVPACPLLILGVGELIDRAGTMRRRTRRVLVSTIAALAVAGAVVTLVSLWVPYTYTRSYLSDIPGWQQMPMDELNDLKAQRLSDQYNAWWWSPIVLNLRSLDDAARYDPPGFPLRWWEGGPSVVGVGTLLFAVATLGGAVVAVSVDGRRDGTHPPGAVRW